jgi:hypothetical protein
VTERPGSILSTLSTPPIAVPAGGPEPTSGFVVRFRLNSNKPIIYGWFQSTGGGVAFIGGCKVRNSMSDALMIIDVQVAGSFGPAGPAPDDEEALALWRFISLAVWWGTR